MSKVEEADPDVVLVRIDRPLRFFFASVRNDFTSKISVHQRTETYPTETYIKKKHSKQKQLQFSGI